MAPHMTLPDSTSLDLRPYARYRIEPCILDVIPIGTFFISAGKPEDGGRPETAMRLVRPNEPRNYPTSKLTPGGRLLFYFWRHTDGARKALGMAAITKTWRWIVQPGEPGYELLDAFKIACDHRRGKPVSTGLLCRALGLEPV